MIVSLYAALIAALWFALALITVACLWGAALMVHDIIWPTDDPEEHR